MLKWGIDPDREVVLVGAALAAAAGLVLLASPFVDWYEQRAFCDVGGCGAGVSGFSALGAASAVLVFAAVAGMLPLAAAFIDNRATAPLSGVAAVAGLGGALLVLFRIAAVPATVSHPTGARLAGVFIALLGAVGVAGGAALAGIGRRLFDRAPAPWPALAAVAFGSAAIIVSLFPAWVRASPMFGFSGLSESAWDAAPTLAAILLLGAIAILAASALVAVIRWRAAFFALAVGGWLAAAIAATGTVLATRVTAPGGAQNTLAAYEPGYYVCLGGAAVVVCAGVWAAISPRASA